MLSKDTLCGTVHQVKIAEPQRLTAPQTPGIPDLRISKIVAQRLRQMAGILMSKIKLAVASLVRVTTVQQDLANKLIKSC